MKNGHRYYKSASLRVSQFREGIPEPEQVKWISHVETADADRRQGIASELLRRLFIVADRERVALVLEPKPFDDEPLDRNALESWYTRRGFQRFQNEPCLMVRYPRQ